MMHAYVYRDFKKDLGVFTVGFFTPDGKWEPESDYNTSEEAAKRVHFLNGGDKSMKSQGATNG